MQFIFIVYQVEGYQNILKLSCRPLAFTSYKAFLKNKKRYGTSLPASLSALFSEKSISLVIFYLLINSHCLVAPTSWDAGQCVYCNCLLTNKHLNILRTKATFTMKQKAFFIIFKGPLLKQIKRKDIFKTSTIVLDWSCLDKTF